MKMRKASDMQLKAICHGEGPARVLAGPGSGKTFTIIQRIHYLIEHSHISPDKILCVTFTKAAAIEMERRFQSLSEKKVCFGTLHSICFQILRRSGKFKHFSLIKESQKRKIIESLLVNNMQIGNYEEDLIWDILSAISKKKNMPSFSTPDFLLEEQFLKLFEQYEDMLLERKWIDFDDMIQKALILLQEDQEIRMRWQSLFSYILVDEFQDMNENQYKIVRLLSQPECNLFVVGDDDQSIYGFRGADPGIMKRFTMDFPSAKQLLLTENYRSGSEIVRFAAEMIKENIMRLPKEPIALKEGGNLIISYGAGRLEEENCMLRHIKKLNQDKLKNSAVILRTNREVAQYTFLLKKAAIPVKELKEDKEDYLHHFIMKDICAFLRFIREGNRREDFLQFMNKPERYLSRMALHEINIKENDLLIYYKSKPKLIKEIKKLFLDLKKASQMSPSLAIRYFRKIIGYDNYLREKSVNEQEIIKWLQIADKCQVLFQKIKLQEKVDCFLERIEKEDGNTSENRKIDYSDGIAVLTMHSAKGLEFSSVFLPDLNEGVIPVKNCKTEESIEEERRLLYVAITRAQNDLYLYFTSERNRKPTRFLEKKLVIDDPHQ